MQEVDVITEKSRFLLVDAAALPDVFLRVVEAKQLLAQGKARSLSEAAELVGISRSTFYKYKDCVFTYEAAMAREIATLSMELEDRAGVLSLVLALISESGANILTINQNIPVDGVAPVSISLRPDELGDTPDELVRKLRMMEGVVNIRLLAN